MSIAIRGGVELRKPQDRSLLLHKREPDFFGTQIAFPGGSEVIAMKNQNTSMVTATGRDPCATVKAPADTVRLRMLA